MPLTEKGQKIMAAMIAEYGSESKGKEVFYASKNAKKIEGVDEEDECNEKYRRSTKRDPFGREKSITSRDSLFQTTADMWSPEARLAAIEARRRKSTGGPIQTMPRSTAVRLRTVASRQQKERVVRREQPIQAPGKTASSEEVATAIAAIRRKAEELKKGTDPDKPESIHKAGPAGTYEHRGTANLAAQGYKPKGRAENTQHGAALTAWHHAKNIGKPATAALGGRGWTIARPGQSIPMGTPHMIVHPEGVVHAYEYKLKKDAKIRGKDAMPLFQTIEDYVGSLPFHIVPERTLDLAPPDFTDSSPNSMVMYDKVDLDDAAALRYTADGYLVAQPRVARTGIQLYKGSECGRIERDIVRVLRPADSVFAQDALRSFAHRPVTLEHPPEPITADNWKKYAVGQLGDEVLKDGEYVRVPMVLMDASAIKSFKEDGNCELSMGYCCDIEWTDGVTDSGEKYDAIQRNIRGNHLAMVKCARGGSKLKLGDISAKGDCDMSDTLRTVIVDGINVQMSDTAAQVVQRTIQMLQDQAENFKEKSEEKEEEAKKAKEKKDAATAEAATIISTKDAEIATLKSQLKDAEMTPQKLDALVKDRSEVIDKALVALNDKNASFDGKTVNEIRRQVVDSKLGSQAKTWTDEMVTASFNTLTADTKPKQGGYRDAASALSRPGFVDDGDAREAAYRQYDADLAGAYKGKQ